MEPRIQQHNLRDQALEILKARLISGDFAPGEIYSAAALATELGVSNSPVREAMLTLVNQGLMEAVRNRGFRVIPIRRKQLEDIYEVRLLLEIPTVSKLAGMPERMREHEAELRETISRLHTAAENGDTIGYLTADKDFHLGLASILGNPYLVATVESLCDQVRQYGVRGFDAQTVLSRSADEHAKILDTILQGDAAAVAKLMEGHLHKLIEDWGGAD